MANEYSAVRGASGSAIIGMDLGRPAGLGIIELVE
jgi:hypothetical protein